MGTLWSSWPMEACEAERAAGVWLVGGIGGAAGAGGTPASMPVNKRCCPWEALAFDAFSAGGCFGSIGLRICMAFSSSDVILLFDSTALIISGMISGVTPTAI